MQNYAGEAVALFRDLLIRVTSFFRDQAAFDRLASDVLPELMGAGGGREIRFWVAGCSTGEEAYSLAMLVRETAEKFPGASDVKIFATDIDADAVRFAAAGSYPESVVADLPPAYLAKYFYRRDEGFQVSRGIREMVVFAQHNLIKDPPFTNISLVSCRNLLIYLQPVLQRKVIDFFNFSLVPGGCLFLGTSETTGEGVDYFEPLDAKLRIYRSMGKAKQPENLLGSMVTDTRIRESRDRYACARRGFHAADEERMLERFIESLGPEILPLSVIVNEQLEVLHLAGDTTDFFKLPVGKLSSDITKLAVKELAVPLATGIQKCFRQRQEVKLSGILIRRGAETVSVDLLVRLLPQKKGQENLAAVIVQGSRRREDPEGESLAYDVAGAAEQRIHDLEQELQFSRENLQATIEELETSNEELQATNEELLASNEELQSTNEELQSTNEELQSTNEELFTVNAEYHSKIIELTELHNDVDNILTASHIGQLLLDENLEVRRFSPGMGSLFKLLDSDVGRPITHIQHQLLDFDPVAAIRKVMVGNEPLSTEVRSDDGRWYLLRILPYAVGPGVFSGVVLSFSDISEVKAAETALQASRERLDLIANASPALFWMAGLDKGCTWFNRTWLEFTGRTMEEELGNGWAEGVHPEDYPRCLATYVEAFDARRPFSMEYRLRRANGEYRWILDCGQPNYGEDGSFEGFVGACLDLSDYRRRES
jgi:two-component system CheB/CheR fusion protein